MDYSSSSKPKPKKLNEAFCSESLIRQRGDGTPSLLQGLLWKTCQEALLAITDNFYKVFNEDFAFYEEDDISTVVKTVSLCFVPDKISSDQRHDKFAIVRFDGDIRELQETYELRLVPPEIDKPGISLSLGDFTTISIDQNNPDEEYSMFCSIEIPHTEKQLLDIQEEFKISEEVFLSKKTLSDFLFPVLTTWFELKMDEFFSSGFNGSTGVNGNNIDGINIPLESGLIEPLLGSKISQDRTMYILSVDEFGQFNKAWNLSTEYATEDKKIDFFLAQDNELFWFEENSDLDVIKETKKNRILSLLRTESDKCSIQGDNYCSIQGDNYRILKDSWSFFSLGKNLKGILDVELVSKKTDRNPNKQKTFENPDNEEVQYMTI